MVTGAVKHKIDNLWQEFWQGGIANPATVIEQITYLMFARLLDLNEIKDEKIERIGGKRRTKPRFKPEQQHIRWSNLRHEADPEKLVRIVRDEVFTHFKDASLVGDFSDYMKDARLAIDKPSLLMKALEIVSQLPLESGDSKGDLYEYVLSKLSTAGINGQFRTPRHIIRLMVELINPNKGESICDPSCGTGGFLSSSFQFIEHKYTSKEGFVEVDLEDADEKSDKVLIATGDLLSDAELVKLKNDSLFGFDFDATMLRISGMNMLMHGTDAPNIRYQDSLAHNFIDKYPGFEKDAFDIILANPPFKGSLDEDTVNPSILRLVKTKKTELLFIVQILRMLKLGGRSATIVPSGTLFGSSKAHQEVRRILIEDHQLDAVIQLPPGVFKPYAGVETAILMFTKGGKTDQVWFYQVDDDGFTLDDKRTPLHFDDSNRPLDFSGDLPKVLAAFKTRDFSHANTERNDRKENSFFVSNEELAANNYDLTIRQYQEVIYPEVEYDPPEVILDQLEALEAEIQSDLRALRSML